MERSKFWSFLSLPLFLGVLPSTDAHNYKRDEKNGVFFANFAENPSVRLKAFVLETLMASNHRQCTFECINNKHCYSVNFAASLDDGKPSCQLLNTDKFMNAHDLVADERFDHYNIKTPCMNNPCKNEATCRPIYNRDEYQCICKPGFTGQDCGTDINECSSNPCLNGGTCVDQVNGFNCTCTAGYTGVHCERVTENWIQMNPSVVCFGAKGNSYGAFNTPTPGRIITFKLKYKSGYVNCAGALLPKYRSKWGCTWLRTTYTMGTRITDSKRNPILPKGKYLKGGWNCLNNQFYKLPWANTKSDVLRFDDFTEPKLVSAGQKFQVWFVEDLTGCGEWGNESSKTCAEVYGLYV